MDDGAIDLSIMHKMAREMTGALLVGSLWKQAINLQGNNNDSSQGNKGHPLLPIVINLTYSSIGGKKNVPSLTTQEVLQPTNLICNHLSLQWDEYNFGFFFFISCFPITPVERGETGRDSLEHVGKKKTPILLAA